MVDSYQITANKCARMLYILTCILCKRARTRDTVIRTYGREDRCSEVKCSGELPLLSGLVWFRFQHNRLDQPVVVEGYVVLVEDDPFYSCAYKERKNFKILYAKKLLHWCAMQHFKLLIHNIYIQAI